MGGSFRVPHLLSAFHLPRRASRSLPAMASSGGNLWSTEASATPRKEITADLKGNADEFFNKARAELQSRIDGHEHELEVNRQPGWYSKDEVPDMDVAAEQPQTDVPEGIRGLLSRLEVENQASLEVEQRQINLLERVSQLSEEVAQSDWRMRIGNKMDNFREALVEDQQETTIIESRAADLKDR